MMVQLKTRLAAANRPAFDVAPPVVVVVVGVPLEDDDVRDEGVHVSGSQSGHPYVQSGAGEVTPEPNER